MVYEIENKRSYEMDRSCKGSTTLSGSMQNIPRSLPELSSFGHCINEIERKRDNTVAEHYMDHSLWQLSNCREKAFEGDSSTLFWNRNMFNANRSYDFNQKSHNVIFTAGELQSRFNAFNNSQSRNAFAESSSPHWSVSGLPMNQSEGEPFDAKDSNDKEKRKLTRQYFVAVFSICYAIFLVIFGAIIFVVDVFNSQYPLPQAFCIYMLLMAFAYFLYLYIDIRLHVHRAKNELKHRIERKQRIDDYIKNLNNDGALKLATTQPSAYVQAIRELNLPPLEAVLHRYCFVLGRHGASLYVKLGASCFAFGLLVYSALQVSYDVFFISSYGNYLYDCASYVTLVLNILFPIYSLFTLFFIVKYMNVVINVNQNLARMFLMHIIGTSLSLWVFTIIRETADAIAESDAEHSGLRRATKYSNETFEFVYDDCGKSNALNAIHRQFAPYLYPFVIEYCILVVGVCCKIYENINHCPRKSIDSTTIGIDAQSKRNVELAEDSATDYSAAEYDHISEHDKAIHTSFHIQVDCHSSFSGIFFGLLLLIMSIVFIILMYAGLQNRAYLQTSIWINNVFEFSSLFCLIVCCIIAYMKTVELDINPNSAKALQMEDILLLIAMPAFFIDSIFSLAPALKNGSVLQICIVLYRVIEVLIQTPFIIDGRRRCSNCTFKKEKKPGRELVIFLTIANLSVWIYHTFSGKTVYASDERYAYYGFHLWNIMNHICMPLKMFYRFHASVCLVDIWNHAYEPAENHK